MTKRLISFATPHYATAQARLAQTAIPWFDQIHSFGPDDLDDEFLKRHANLTKYRRGYFLWSWKPHFLLRALRELSTGDIVMYCDSQIMFIDDPAPLFKLCISNGGFLPFHQKRERRLNGTHTRRDCFIKMGCDSEEYWNGSQLNTAAIVFSPTPLSIDVVEEWYRWCSDEQVVSDAVSVLGPELPQFKDHRHDQSILALVTQKRGITSWPDATQWGNGFHQDGRNYGQIMQIDRLVSHQYPIPDRGH